MSTLAAFFLPALLATASADPAVRGTVRSGFDGHPVKGAVVEVVDLALSVRTDSVGEYSFSGLAPGNHTLRFSAAKYSAMLAAIVLGEELFELDVTLTPSPIELENVKILATTDLTGSTRVISESGSWLATEEVLERSPMLKERDALRILGASPQVQFSPEAPATVHVRGGSADQNLMLLDGVPVYDAIHSGEVFSAVNPDVIESVRLHGGVPSARYGGRLSSIVDVRTRAASANAGMRGAFSPTSARATVDLPLPALASGVSLSVRHSYSGMLSHRADRDRSGWSDFLGRASVAVRGSNIELLLFSSGDRVSFGNPARDTSTVLISGASLSAIPTSLSWSTLTSALIWERTNGRLETEMRLWSTEANADFDIPAGNGAAHLASRALNNGASGSLSHRDVTGTSSASFTFEHLPTSYVLMEAVPSQGTPTFPQALDLSSRPTIGTASIERRQVIGSRWTLSAGVRGGAATSDRIRWDPRISLGFAPVEGIALSVGYARLHQYVQSLRNEESLLDAIIGIDLPVAIGANGIPVATGDEIVGIGSVPLGSRARLTVNAYSRWADGLVLVAPVSVRPFATQAFAQGVGRAWGGGVIAEGIAGRFSWSGTYALSEVRRAAFSRSYHPSFAPTHSASFNGGVSLGQRTRLKASLWAARGRPTTPVSGGFGWEWQGSISRARKVTGIPVNATGVISGERLPVYLRVDAGARHDFVIGKSRAHFTAFANIDNIFDRRNTIGYTTTTAGEGLEALRMMPLSATFGLEWRF